LFFNIAFSGAVLLSLYIGLKHDIIPIQRFGSIFFCIDIVTKYFKCFWNSYNESVFFYVLGVFFLVVTLDVLFNARNIPQILLKIKERRQKSKNSSVE
jgi:uncharacterized membrane protein